MIALKFKEVDENTYRIGAQIKFKPYYTMQEKLDIFDSIRVQTNSFMRDYALIVGTAKVCTNIDFDGMEDVEIYEICAENQLIKDFECVDEYTKMIDLVERDETVYKLAKGITETLEEKFKDINLDELQKKLDLKALADSIKGKKK